MSATARPTELPKTCEEGWAKQLAKLPYDPPVRLYVCCGTFPYPGGNPCRNAYEALEAAGHRPEVIKALGCFGTDRFFADRREVRRLTGNYKVPTLVLDDGTVVDDSKGIAAWAAANPA